MTDMVPVTGRAPIGFLPARDGTNDRNLVVWECAVCFSLINDIEGHSRWHESNG